MYFGDFQALLRRNQASNAHITYYQDPDINPNQVAIFDRLQVRRNPDLLAKTGYDAEDHWRDSHVCELGVFNGEVPLEGYVPPTQANKLAGKPYRGALAAIEMLISSGSLRRSDELRELLSRNGRRLT